MPKDFSWQYSVVQHFPDVVRGECVNFGVMVKDFGSGRVLIRLDEDRSRLAAIDPSFNDAAHRLLYPAGVHEYQEEPGLLKIHDGSAAQAMSMTQYTPPRGGIGDRKKDTLESLLEWAFDKFVSPVKAG